MILEFLILVVGYYLFIGISFYTYGVFKSWEITGVWRFFIKDNVVAGLVKCPKWTVFWLESLINKMERK